MALTGSQALEVYRDLKDMMELDRQRCDIIREIITEKNRITWLPTDTPADIRKLGEVSRVNFIPLIVNSLVQSMFVDGFRSPTSEGDIAGWQIWQQNRMDKWQIGVHDCAVKYGIGYTTVVPSDQSEFPNISGKSPRKLVASYAEDDDDYPVYALEKVSESRWRLFDSERVYFIQESGDSVTARVSQGQEHLAGVVPVIRFTDTVNLDDPVIGNVLPHVNLQNQINITTFALLVAQHYGAHRQRYILGWMAESEEQKMKAAASKLWTFDENPDEIQIGEFQQTILDGYINSREASLRHLATCSQTPAHELLGQLVNMSAEALAVAQASRTRKLGVVKTCCGEGWEQTLNLATRVAGGKEDPMAWVRWKDTETRSLAQVADAFGKLATMLNIPVEALWERIPEIPQQEVEVWKALRAAEPDPAPDPNPDPAPDPGPAE